MFQKSKKILNNNNGAVAVLLMCIMGSFILIIGILMAASVSASGKSYSDATLRLAGKSILSEYDRKVLDEYGLLCFRGDEREIEDKIEFYANASFDRNKAAYTGLTSNKKRTELLKLQMEDLSATLKEYSMVNVDLFENQVKSALKTKFLEVPTRTENHKELKRTLKNEVIINSLPSAGYKGSVLPSFNDIKSLPDWDEIKNSTTGKFAGCEYTMKVFKHANKGSLPTETFFSNEIEYILAGNMSDESNYTEIKVKLSALRMAANTLHIVSNKTKMAEVTRLAAPASAAVGIGSVAAAAAIIATWAAAETENDIALLEQGDNVSLSKTSSTWALDNIAEILEGVTREKAVKPVNKSGQSYSDYLRIFLYLQDRETRLLRMMDLIQINLKGTYYKEFLLKEHYAGFRFNTNIKGDEFHYAEQY